MKQGVSNFIKTFGPGIMFAGTCIGGSHLVQSTRAGAYYGFGLLLIVLLANIFKYPFFEFASRYTNATGKSILDGYYKLNKYVLVVYGIVTFFSMFIITAAIGSFTAGLADNIFTSLFGKDILSTRTWAIIMFLIVLGILFKGEFKILDKLLKGIGIILVITIFTAIISLVISEPMPKQGLTSLQILKTDNGLIFAIALMGWMPTGVDMSSWHSLWTEQKIKDTGYHPSLKETLLDFNIGYGITILLAILFLSIGAYILYEDPYYTPEKISKMGALQYANTLVNMFTKAVGYWSFFIIAIAAFATMFGTCITLIDGYSRSMERTSTLLTQKSSSKSNYLIWVVTIMIGALVIIFFFVSSLSKIIDLATITSFIIAPFAALINYLIVLSKDVSEDKKPKLWLKTLAITGIIFLSFFTVLYLYSLSS